jgi:hypothetical protein
LGLQKALNLGQEKQPLIAASHVPKAQKFICRLGDDGSSNLAKSPDQSSGLSGMAVIC